MKEKIEQAIKKCLEENGYYVRQVSIGELPKIYATEEDSLMLVNVPLDIKATNNNKWKTSLGY